MPCRCLYGRHMPFMPRLPLPFRAAAAAADVYCCLLFSLILPVSLQHTEQQSSLSSYAFRYAAAAADVAMRRLYLLFCCAFFRRYG